MMSENLIVNHVISTEKDILPIEKSKTIKKINNYNEVIKKFFEDGNDNILVMTSITKENRNKFAIDLKNIAQQRNIDDICVLVHSSRFFRKVDSQCKNFSFQHKLQSVYRTIYENKKTDKSVYRTIYENKKTDKRIDYVKSSIRTVDSQRQNTLFIVLESQLISNENLYGRLSMFGTGELLKDFFTYAKQIPGARFAFIGDKFALTLGAQKKSALSPKMLLFLNENSEILVYDEPVSLCKDTGKTYLQSQLALAIEKNCFNKINYSFDCDTLDIITHEDATNLIKSQYSNPLTDFPRLGIILSEREKCHLVNVWIHNMLITDPNMKTKKIKIVKGDLLISETPYEHEFVNGAYCVVKKVIKREIPIRQTSLGETLTYTKIEAWFPSEDETQIIGEDETQIININDQFFSDEKGVLTSEQLDALKDALFDYFKDNDAYKEPFPALARLGWAITAHKSLSSTFTDVIINADTYHPQKASKDYFRWLYTALSFGERCKIYNIQRITPFRDTIFKRSTDTLYNESKNFNFIFDNFQLPQVIPDSISIFENVDVKKCVLIIINHIKDEFKFNEIKKKSDFLTQIDFFCTYDNSYLKIDIYNKGKKDNFCISKISVNPNSTVCDNQIRNINIEIENIKSLYANNNVKIATNIYNEILSIYKELHSVLANKGIIMDHIKSLPYHDIFRISDDKHHVYYKCWYNSKGFITKIEYDCDDQDPLICLLKEECENAQ